MAHANYFQIKASTHYHLGIQEGRLFGASLREAICDLKERASWSAASALARAHLSAATKALPHLIEELRGYAYGARVSLYDLWVLCIEDELFGPEDSRCTTVVTNGGLLIGHNEDCEEDAEDSVCVLRKTIGNLTILELFYWTTLGGNAVSINSHGYVQTINTLTHLDQRAGVPRNLTARWLSETSSPDADYKQLTRMPRSSGYNHNLVSLDGRIWNIECSATRQILTRPESPFVHTNHFLTELRELEGDHGPGTTSRYCYASSRTTDPMTTGLVEQLLGDSPVFNERTIAKIIVDLARMSARIWLLREAERGWVDYDIGFAKSPA